MNQPGSPQPPQSSGPSAAHEETLELLLDEWEEALERGEHPEATVICRRHPHLLPDFIAKTEQLAKLDGKLNQGHPPSVRFSPQGKKMPEAQPCDALDWRSHVDRLEYHAHGGLGIVFRGFDRQLHRDVAIKFVRERRRNNPLDVQRFRVEAEITSRLDHPGVVPVHGYGLTANGVPFYAMRMVEGNTLQECIDAYHNKLKEKPDPSETSVEFRKLLSAFVSVCNTIEYAHNRGVVNCDIKPGNIMLGKYGETIVLDWGCAKYVGSAGKAKSVGEESLKPLTDSNDSDHSGLTGGTPVYMSPEQHAQSEEIGPASDIYSLGVTLYRLMTGQPAFSPESTLAKIRESVLFGRYRKPTDVCPWLSKALEAISLKAMSLSPEDRYRSAADLAQDLERYLADEETEAYVEPISRRIARLMRRHRAVTQVLMVSLGVLIMVSTVFAVVMGRSANREAAARQQATDMRNLSLQLAARSAATSMALRINDAWRILEIEASMKALQDELLRIRGMEERSAWEPLQEWLEQRAALHELSSDASSWFVCDSEGRQIARHPIRESGASDVYDSVGENFAHRDYFHGNGHDLLIGQRGDPPHIEQVHLSRVYQSINTESLKVAFTIPVYSEETPDTPRIFLGVLGYSVPLGRFAVLQDEEESESLQQIPMLVDLRRNGNDAEHLYGAVLQHPHLREHLRQLQRDKLLGKALPRLDALTLQTIEEHRQTRIEEIRATGFAAPTNGVLLLEDFQDPFEIEAAGSIIAACEPVCVVGRSGRLFDTGWLVIIEEFEARARNGARRVR